MTIPQLLSAEADAATQRYDLLIDSFRMIHQQAIANSSFGSARQLSRATSHAYEAAHAYLSSEAIQIAQSTSRIASEALTATLHELNVSTADETQGRISDHLSALNDHLCREISIQIERDIATLQRELRRSYLDVALASRSTGISTRSALNHYRISGAQAPEFSFTDRGNRRWPSRRFIRASFRSHLLSTYNDSVLMTLADHGVNQAQVLHSNPSSEYHGMLLSLGANSDLPTYSDVRNEVFHPNSDAILKRAA